jgi:hypothetical protein
MTSFKNVTFLGQSSPQEIVRDNVIAFVDWSLLTIGAYINVNIPSSGHYGGDTHVLRSVADPRFTSGRVKEMYHKNLVWESGTGYTPEPIPISGVYVNGVLTTSGFYIDYPNGRVVFDNPIPANSSIQAAYSHKYVSVVRAEDVPFFREGVTRSFRIDSSNYSTNSGIYSELTQKRIELPCIAIETVKNITSEPYELGGTKKSFGNIILHVIGEDCKITERLCFILSNQKYTTLQLFDSNYIKSNSLEPLDYLGSLNDGAKTYPQMIAWSGDGGYRTSYNKKVYIADASSVGTEEIAPKLYHAPVRWKFEAILPAN